MKMIFKIIALPLILILAVAGLLLNAGIKAYCLASAIVFKVLGLDVTQESHELHLLQYVQVSGRHL